MSMPCAVMNASIDDDRCGLRNLVKSHAALFFDNPILESGDPLNLCVGGPRKDKVNDSYKTTQRVNNSFDDLTNFLNDHDDDIFMSRIYPSPLCQLQ